MQIVTLSPTVLPSHEKLRVAAYARVSADKDEAFHSLAQQVGYYTAKIAERPDWALFSIYADEAISGTREDRPEFLRMMKDARAHRFDLLITKSVSRLARNTVALLKTVRELKNLGIDILFESENLHSNSPDGELMLTLLALYAEEEAWSSSENKKWQIRERFSNGDPIYIRLYGYRWQEGRLIIIPEEAKVVQRIFSLYLSGKGPQAISRLIQKEQLGDGRIWSRNTIAHMLRNEKYKGELLLQKTYRPDFMTKKRYDNTGQWPRYLVREAHEPIIPPEVFNQVQEEIKRRKEHFSKNQVPEAALRYAPVPLFTGLLICGKCKGRMVRKRCSNAKGKPYKWLCRRYCKCGKDACAAKLIHESILIQKSREVLGIPDEAELTREHLTCRVGRIEVYPDKLRFYLKNGQVETAAWETRSRKRS